MSIRDRIRRLEDGQRCPECTEPDPVRAVYPSDPEPEPEHCPGCGRSVGVIIRVEYEGEEGGA